MDASSDMVAVVGGTVIDGNGGKPINEGVILIEGKRIAAVGDRSTQIPSRAKQIAAAGKFVIPGLMNACACLVDGVYPTTLIRFDGRYDEVAIEAAQIALRGGVTTVFDTWGPRDSLIKARDAINQGLVTASRIQLAGNIVGYDGPFSDDFRPQHRAAVPDAFAARIDSAWQHNVGQALGAMSVEQVRQEIRKYARSGINFLNYAVTDHRAGAVHYIVFSPRVQRVIVEEAHRGELPVMGFSPMTEEALVLTLDAGIDLTFVVLNASISAETVQLIAERRIPCGFSAGTRKASEWFHQRAKSNPANPYFASQEIGNRNARALIEAGAVPLMLAGGGVYSADYMNSSVWQDVQNEWYPPGERSNCMLGESHFYWLQAMQDNGMKPMDALMAATRNIAKAHKLDSDLGTLEQGKFADLLILDRNPLESAEHYRTISLVMKEGKLVDRDALPTQKLITAPVAEAT